MHPVEPDAFIVAVDIKGNLCTKKGSNKMLKLLLLKIYFYLVFEVYLLDRMQKIIWETFLHFKMISAGNHCCGN
jgi:hypothetical protein